MAKMTIDSGKEIDGFVDRLNHARPQDNRDKRHSLAFVIVGFVLAKLVGHQTPTS